MKTPTILVLLLPLLVYAQTQNQCIPTCVKGGTPPNRGGSPCLCTFEATLSGCTVAACEPGADATTTYTCQCTPENHQYQCISLRCTNGTEANSAVATAVSQPIDQAAVASCNNLCKCGAQPPDCTSKSESPYEGAPACSCNPVAWPTGCTLRPCQEGDTGKDYYFCECTAEYSPDFCLSPQCKRRFL